MEMFSFYHLKVEICVLFAMRIVCMSVSCDEYKGEFRLLPTVTIPCILAYSSYFLLVSTGYLKEEYNIHGPTFTGLCTNQVSTHSSSDTICSTSQ